MKRLRRQWESELDEARARSDQEFALRLDRLRGGYRAKLDEVRSDWALAHAESTAALADWGHPVWGDVGEGGAAKPGDASPVVSVRVGDLVLTSRALEGERVSFPLPVVTGSTGVIAVDHGPLGSQPVQAGLVGLCVRLLAISEPGTVSIAWFDAGVQEGRPFVPDVWRPANTLREHLTMLGERLADRWQSIDASDAEPGGGGAPGVAPDGTFAVTVVVGPSAGTVEELQSWLDVHAKDGPRLGSLLVVASEQPIASGGPGVLRIVADEDAGSFVLPDDFAIDHGFVFQAAPHEQLVRRVAERSIAPSPPVLDDGPAALSDSSPEPSAEPSNAPSAQPDAEPPPAGTEASETIPARRNTPIPDRGNDENAGSTPTPDAGDPAESRGSPGASWLSSLLREPPTMEPILTVGHLVEGGHARLPRLGDTIWRGGDELVARGVLGSCLIEALARTRARDVHTRVLDLGQDADTVDLFEAIGSQVPHVVNVTEGISVGPTLEEIAARADTRSDSAARLLLIVFDPGTDFDESRRVKELIDRIASKGPEGAVTALVWTRSRELDDWSRRGFRSFVDVEGGRMGLGGWALNDDDSHPESALQLHVEPLVRLEDLAMVRDELWRARR